MTDDSGSTKGATLWPAPQPSVATDPAAEALRKWAVDKAIQMLPVHVGAGSSAERVISAAKEIERYVRGEKA